MAYKVGTTAVVNDSAQVLSSQLTGALPALDASSLTGRVKHPMRQFMICHTSHWSVHNGGCCLAWNVPDGTQTIFIELQGGGGPGGSSGYDYDISTGGWGGNYAAKMYCLAAGHFSDSSTYQLCAGGTSHCSCCAHCQPCRTGCTSWVADGLGSTNFCATGGEGGWTAWDKQSSCYDCSIGAQCVVGNQVSGGWGQCQSCTPGWWGGDWGFTGTMGMLQKSYDCCSDQSGTRGGPTGPFAGSQSNGRDTNMCTTTGMGCCRAHSYFPGGGGGAAGFSGGNGCWGGFGAGGVLRVTYM